MKLSRKILVLATVTVAASTAAILPMAASNASTACATSWSSSAVYVKNNTASQSGHNYTAKWWTQNDSPATHSGQWDVWADNGQCWWTTPPTTFPTLAPTTAPTPAVSTRAAVR